MLDLLLSDGWVTSLLAGKKGRRAVFTSGENAHEALLAIADGVVTFSVPATVAADPRGAAPLRPDTVDALGWRLVDGRYLTSASDVAGFYARCKLAANQCGWYDIKAIQVRHEA